MRKLKHIKRKNYPEDFKPVVSEKPTKIVPKVHIAKPLIKMGKHHDAKPQKTSKEIKPSVIKSSKKADKRAFEK